MKKYLIMGVVLAAGMAAWAENAAFARVTGLLMRGRLKNSPLLGSFFGIILNLKEG